MRRRRTRSAVGIAGCSAVLGSVSVETPAAVEMPVTGVNVAAHARDSVVTQRSAQDDQLALL